MQRTKGPQKPSQIRRDASGRFASPERLTVEQFPASQQGAWTQAGKARREAELERRRSQHKPATLDSEIAAWRKAELCARLDKPWHRIKNSCFEWEVLDEGSKGRWRDQYANRANPLEMAQFYSRDRFIKAHPEWAGVDTSEVHFYTHTKPLSLDSQAEIVAAVDADPDAEVKAYRAAWHHRTGIPVVPWDEVTDLHLMWHEEYAAHKAREASTPTLPQPEPANVAPASPSQACDTLSVTHTCQPEPADYEPEPSRLVFGLWCAIAGAATVAVAVTCLQAMGVF